MQRLLAVDCSIRGAAVAHAAADEEYRQKLWYGCSGAQLLVVLKVRVVSDSSRRTAAHAAVGEEQLERCCCW